MPPARLSISPAGFAVTTPRPLCVTRSCPAFAVRFAGANPPGIGVNVVQPPHPPPQPKLNIRLMTTMIHSGRRTRFIDPPRRPMSLDKAHPVKGETDVSRAFRGLLHLAGDDEVPGLCLDRQIMHSDAAHRRHRDRAERARADRHDPRQREARDRLEAARSTARWRPRRRRRARRRRSWGRRRRSAACRRCRS